jgi:hypothetical protein
VRKASSPPGATADQAEAVLETGEVVARRAAADQRGVGGFPEQGRDLGVLLAGDRRRPGDGIRQSGAEIGEEGVGRQHLGGIIQRGDGGAQEPAIYHEFDNDNLFVAVLAILMTGVLLLGMLRRERHGIAGIGFESALVLALYVGSVALLLA